MTLPERLRLQALNVEQDGWINAARYMRQAADELEQKQDEPDDGQPDETQEWADYDRDC